MQGGGREKGTHLFSETSLQGGGGNKNLPGDRGSEEDASRIGQLLMESADAFLQTRQMKCPKRKKEAQTASTVNVCTASAHRGERFLLEGKGITLPETCQSSEE